jgi:hypothetical protein
MKNATMRQFSSITSTLVLVGSLLLSNGTIEAKKDGMLRRAAKGVVSFYKTTVGAALFVPSIATTAFSLGLIHYTNTRKDIWLPVCRRIDLFSGLRRAWNSEMRLGEAMRLIYPEQLYALAGAGLIIGTTLGIISYLGLKEKEQSNQNNSAIAPYAPYYDNGFTSSSDDEYELPSHWSIKGSIKKDAPITAGIGNVVDNNIIAAKIDASIAEETVEETKIAEENVHIA